MRATSVLRPLGPALVLFAFCLPAAAEEAKGIAGLAKDLQQLVSAQKQTAIAVGDFTGPPDLVGGGGTGLQEALIRELRALKVDVNPKASLVVKGEYLFVEDPKDKERDRGMMRVILTVRNHRGTGVIILDGKVEKVVERTGLVRNNRELVKAAGVTVSVPANMDDADANEKIYRQLKTPSVFVDGTRIKATKNSPYSVEVWVRKDEDAPARPRKPKVEDGQAFLTLREGEFYEVRIRNNTKFEAGVAIHIDGLDVFTFSTQRVKANGKPRKGYYILRANGGFTTVPGWFINPDRADLFTVTSYAKSEAAKLLKSNAKAGTITVLFHPAWKGKTPPDGAKSRSAGLGTGRGPSKKDPRVEVERTIGALREAVTVRYRK
jgi:hypothetical protein